MNKYVKILMGLFIVSSMNLSAGHGGDALVGGMAGGMMGGMLSNAMTSKKDKTVIIQQAPAPAAQASQNLAELDAARSNLVRAENRANAAERRVEELERKLDTLTSKVEQLTSKLEKQQESKETKTSHWWWPF